MDILEVGDEVASTGTEIDARISELEQLMPQLYRRHASVFELAGTWAERHDEIIAMAPPAQRIAIEVRLARIGIRWGVVPGARVTTEFRIGDVAALAHARRRPRG